MARGFSQKAEEISKLRKELNVYSEDLHKKQSYGLSIYELINNYELNAGFPDIPAFSQEALGNVTKELLEKQNQIIESLITAARAVGHPAEHALSRVGCKEYNQSLKDDLDSKATKYLSNLEKLKELATDFQNAAELTNISDDLEWSKLLTTAEQVAKWSYLPKAWADHKGMNICMTEIAEMAEHFSKSKELRTDL